MDKLKGGDCSIFNSMKEGTNGIKGMSFNLSKDMYFKIMSMFKSRHIDIGDFVIFVELRDKEPLKSAIKKFKTEKAAEIKNADAEGKQIDEEYNEYPKPNVKMEDTNLERINKKIKYLEKRYGKDDVIVKEFQKEKIFAMKMLQASTKVGGSIKTVKKLKKNK